MPSPTATHPVRPAQAAERRQAETTIRRTLHESIHEQRLRRLGKFERLIAAASDPHLHEMAAALPMKPERSPGRPLKHPHWCLLLFGQARDIYTSALAVSVELRDEQVWSQVVDAVKDACGEDYVTGLPQEGPTLAQWNYFERVCKERGWYGRLQDTFRELAARRAEAMGMFDPDARFDIAHVRREHAVTFDGKVSTSPSRHEANTEYVDRRTGEIKTRRHDPNSDSWPEAGEEGMQREWGSKGVYAWARLPQSGTRLCLDVDTLRPGNNGGEAEAIVRMSEGLKTRLPGLHAVVTDGVLRHVHIDPLMRRDLLVVNKPTKAASNIPGVRIGDRREKSHHVMTVEGRHRLGLCKHRIYAIGGALYEQRVTDTGAFTYEPIPSRTVRRRRPTYTDWYRAATLECARCGGFKNKNVPLLQSEDDTDAKFLRSEYLRQVAPTDPDFGRLYGFRPDSESGNNVTEQAWHLRRIPAYGWDNQALCMLLHAAQMNAEAWRVHVKRMAAHGIRVAPPEPDDGDHRAA